MQKLTASKIYVIILIVLIDLYFTFGVDVMEYVLDFLLSNFKTIAAFSTGFVTLAFTVGIRFFHARKFLVPARFSYGNFMDYVDSFVVAFALIICGLLLPLLIAHTNLESALAYSIITLSLSISGIVTGVLLSRISNSLLKWSIIVSILIVLTIAVMFFFSALHQSISVFWLNLVAVLHVLGMVFLASMFIRAKIIGDGFLFDKSTTASIVELSSKDASHIAENTKRKYLVTLRHSKTEWILLPCSENDEKDGKNTIYFETDSFVIKELSGLEVRKVRCNRIRPVKT